MVGRVFFVSMPVEDQQQCDTSSHARIADRYSKERIIRNNCDGGGILSQHVRACSTFIVYINQRFKEIEQRRRFIGIHS